MADLEQQVRAAMGAGDWAQAERLGVQLDRMQPAPVSCLEAALWYAEQGLSVFPLQPGSKIPYPGTHGFQDATTDPAQIQAWWAARPDSNLAIATGHLVDVIDIDGPAGVRSMLTHVLDGIGLPPVLGVVDTPRAGGTHYYVAASGDGNAASIWPGIDYRGLGGYVVAPPSVVDSKRYTWRTPLNLDGAH